MKWSSRTCYHWGLKQTPEFITPYLWPPNSPDLNLVDYSVWEILQEKVYKTCITDLAGRTETATENGVGQAGSCRHCGSHSSVASSIGPAHCVVFLVPDRIHIGTLVHGINMSRCWDFKENNEKSTKLTWVTSNYCRRIRRIFINSV